MNADTDHALLEWRANTSTNAATFPVHLCATTSPGTWTATLATPDEDTTEVLTFLLDTDPWLILIRPGTPPTEVRVTSFDGTTSLHLTTQKPGGPGELGGSAGAGEPGGSGQTEG
ncbi:hypothetical protein [Streptomyces sp. SPB074]|uniref:hypothetical protein n=1 Tax=Streptomyces sp. (strain SPB074) TaxID=465543 RepID=UPI00017F1664|nr:hypothetical protein [Streptomyces sp. SPB074]EDY46490.1 hypothetical protein SSBG_04467 [Streptomyces sp. SPB074]